MEGRPAWLASIAMRLPDGSPKLTGEWTRAERRRADKRLDKLLGNVGDPTRERAFRMNLTLCLHRALSDREIATLSDEWKAAPAEFLAGGPVEVLWQKGVADAPSTRPCAEPRMRPLLPGSRVLVPLDCGRCESCVARESIRLSVRSGVGCG